MSTDNAHSRSVVAGTVRRSRYVLFPIEYPILWNAYKTSQSSFWTADEIILDQDAEQWRRQLLEPERNFISVILAFFAASDGIVAENLAVRFMKEVDIPEVQCFYGFQIMMENVHAEVYSKFVQELVEDKAQQNKLFNAIEEMPAVKAKADWCLRWTTATNVPLAQRVIAFAIVEGVFFSSSFAAMFWLRNRNLMPGLTFANELIARDEGQHTDFACLLYHHLGSPVSGDLVKEMIREAVMLEKMFFNSALPQPLVGINASLMHDYVEYVGDFLLNRLGFPVLFGKGNPFPFMDRYSLDSKANFFERYVSDYVGATVNQARPV